MPLDLSFTEETFSEHLDAMRGTPGLDADKITAALLTLADAVQRVPTVELSNDTMQSFSHELFMALAEFRRTGL